MDYKETLTWQDICETSSVLANINSVNSSTMNKIVRAIRESKITNFIVGARGTSTNAATFFKYVLEINSIYTVGFTAPSVFTLYHGKTNYSNSIVLVCSKSGESDDLLEVISKANEQGAITIAVTNNINSNIAQNAKFVLNCNAGESKSAVPTKAYTAQLYLVAWLAFELSRRKDELFLLKNLSKDLEHVFAQLDEVSTHLEEKLKISDNGFILSRGLNYSTALELALRMQEICKINVKGYASSEFEHGPISTLSKDMPVLLLCAENNFDQEMQTKIRADQVKLIKKIMSLNAPVYLVTNDYLLFGRFKKCNDYYINYSLPEELSVIIFTVFSQMLAVKAACVREINPDVKNKATI